MLHIFICEDEEIQLNYIKDMISEYVTCREIDAQIAAAERAPESILKKLLLFFYSSAFLSRHLPNPCIFKVSGKAGKKKKKREKK